LKQNIKLYNIITINTVTFLNVTPNIAMFNPVAKTNKCLMYGWNTFGFGCTNATAKIVEFIPSKLDKSVLKYKMMW